MCTCYRNCVANDCSERMCQFGLAHVDSPKGDLDASGDSLTGPGKVVVVNDQFYPYGTTEQYPAMEDTMHNVAANSAHEYRECSNKGTCDRTTGTCACFDGYEGSACQRASCPSNANGVCSGHGTCQSISDIAHNDFNNIYELWDKDATMGCVCDPGYEGPDCSQRMCKYNVDPMYKDNNATIRYSNWTYFIYTQSATATVYGNYSLVFTDAHGMKWKTEPIDIDATCGTIATALESLPNNVIPVNSVRCFEYPLVSGASSVEPVSESSVKIWSKYTIAFPKNAGRLPQLSLDTHLDGSRPTLYSNEVAADTIGWKVYPNGFHGEDVDFVNDRCFGVTVTLANSASGFFSYLAGLTGEEAALLKRCLGDGNNNPSDNIDVYNWDYGTAENPHLIKLQEATQFDPSLRYDADGNSNWDNTLRDMPLSHICAQSDINANLFGANRCSNKNPPGFYAVLYYEPVSSVFRILHNVKNDYDTTTEFYVYTTRGYLNRISNDAVVFNHRSNHFSTDLKVKKLYSNVLHVDTLTASSTYFGDMSCETTPIGTNGARDCFNKGDWAMFFAVHSNVPNEGDPIVSPSVALGTNEYSANPSYLNMYRIAKIWTQEKLNPNRTIVPQPKQHISRQEIILDYNFNARFDMDGTTAYAYKFHPSTHNADGGYRYFKPCGGRGICNTESGTCECFGGYQGDDCTCQWAMAV